MHMILQYKCYVLSVSESNRKKSHNRAPESRSGAAACRRTDAALHSPAGIFSLSLSLSLSSLFAFAPQREVTRAGSTASHAETTDSSPTAPNDSRRISSRSEPVSLLHFHFQTSRSHQRNILLPPSIKMSATDAACEKTPSTSSLGLFDLSGKTALLTGGTRGIGQACAVALVEAGASVILAVRPGTCSSGSHPALAPLTSVPKQSSSQKHSTVDADLSDLEQVKTLFDRRSLNPPPLPSTSSSTAAASNVDTLPPISPNPTGTRCSTSTSSPSGC